MTGLFTKWDMDVNAGHRNTGKANVLSADTDIFGLTMIQRIAVTILFLVAVTSKAECQWHLKKDLLSEWKSYVHQTYVPFNKDEKPGRTIYFSVDPTRYKGDYLTLSCAKRFSIFLNNKLLLDKVSRSTLSVDSLREGYPNSVLFFAIHGEEKITSMDLSTKIYSTVSKTSRAENLAYKKNDSSFRDFVVTVVLGLAIFLIIMIRSNPGLSSDYFSITKMFSLRESDSYLFHYRLTRSNILFYVFTSMTLAFYLILIDWFIVSDLGSVQITSYFLWMMLWLKISLTILVCLLVKIVLVYLMASLFGLKEIAGVHFFNFIRLVLVFISVLILLLGAYTLLGGHQIGVVIFLQSILGWLLGVWIIVLFLKLSNRIRYSVFHLFSYICATEIIPFLLIVKVLNE